MKPNITNLSICFLLICLSTSCGNNQESTTESTESELDVGRGEVMEQRAHREALEAEDSEAAETAENSVNNEYNDQSDRNNSQTTYNWYCVWCDKIIQKNEKPNGGTCPGANNPKSYSAKSHKESHGACQWEELSIVGSKIFQCSYCGVTVNSSAEPHKGSCEISNEKQNCSGCGHSWNEL